MTPVVEPSDQRTREAIRSEREVSAFVSAGAGTGKSTTLVGRIVATVTAAPNPTPIRNVAAITFTERAAGELRDKVRDALAGTAADDLAGDVAQRALRDVDAAVIGTIHGFAVAILREHALAAGLPLGFEVADDSAAATAKRKRWRDTVDAWQVRLPEQARQHLDAAGIRLIALKPLVDELDRARPRLDPARVSPPEQIDVAARLREVAAGLAILIDEQLAACTDHSDKLAAHLQGPVAGLRDELARADADTLIAMRGRWDELWSRAFKPGNVGTAGAWGSKEDAKAVRDRLKEWQSPVWACLGAPLENAVRVAAEIAWHELDAAQANRVMTGVLEFDDLLLVTRSLLRANLAVRAAVSQRFRVVLVDEFQDTDPVQWDIIRLVTSDPTDLDAVPQPGRLVVVGDPKQAIYSFRGADIRTYLEARGSFPGSPYELVTSFRSVEPIVTWVNTVFASLITASEVQPAYENLVSHHAPQSAIPTGPAVVVLRDAPKPDPDSTIGDDRPQSRALEPQLVATAIQRAVRDHWQITEPTDGGRHREYRRACTYRDIAILVPTRTGVLDLLDALDGAEIPYRSADAKLVLDRPVVSGLISALRVIDDPEDQLSLWWTLKSLLFGCGDDDLLRYRRDRGRWRLPGATEDLPDGPVSDALRVLSQLRSTWVAPQPAAVLDALISGRRVHETLALVPRGTFDADCVRMLQGHAQRWQDDGGVGLSDFVASVEVLGSDTSRATLDEPDDRDDDAVRVSTIHSAKGLEFPVVVLAGMATGQRSDKGSFGVRADGGMEFTVAGIESAGLESWKVDEQAPRSAAELIRLLYVACTRARDHLVVSVVGEVRKGGNAPRSDVLRAPVAAVATDAIDVPTTFPLPSDLVQPRYLAAPPSDWSEKLAQARAAAAAPWVASPSSRDAAALDAGRGPGVDPVGEATAYATADSDRADAGVRRTRDGRPVGRAMHAALDTLFSAAAPPTDDAVSKACHRAVADEGIPGDYDDVRSRVAAAMASPLAAEAFAAERRWPELFLAAPKDHDDIRLTEGYADLVFETADGYVLVDHKSDATMSPEGLAHYREQLAAYAALLESATGRAVVQHLLLHVPGATAQVINVSTQAGG